MPDTQKIMYVEDEPDIQTIARIALEQIGGFDLLVCSSGQAALDQVSDFAPDIILLDVMMPEMDGIETFRQLKTLPACADVPVVFMTARVQTHEIKEYIDLGAVDVIAKPFSPITLAEQVKTIIQNVGR
jgi:two-component system, OmpR family, response regulator